jgi:hypothetical protein
MTKYFIKIAIIILCNGLLYGQGEFWEEYCKLPIFSQYDATLTNVFGQQSNQVVINSLSSICINKSKILFGLKENERTYNDFLYRSIDNGKTWENISKYLPDAVDPEFAGLEKLASYKPTMKALKTHSLRISMWNNNLLLSNGDNAMLGNFIWLSKDNGNTWILVKNKKSYRVNYMFCEFHKDLIIEYGNVDTIRRSIDYGKSWQSISNEDFCTIAVLERQNKNILTENDFYFDKCPAYTSLYKYSNETIWTTEANFLNKPKPSDKNIYVEVADGLNYKLKNIEMHSVNVASGFFGPGGINAFRNTSNFVKHYVVLKKINENEWSTISKINTQSYKRNPAIDCNNVIYFLNDIPEYGQYISTDQGTLWKKLSIYPFDYLDYGSLGFDGKFYMAKDGKLFRSKTQITCNTNRDSVIDNRIKYGTTIITHGTLLHSPIGKSYITWIEKMSQAILDKAQNGIIWLYNKETGSFEKYKELGKSKEGEQILLFDWSDDSALNGKGFVETASQALFLAMTKLNHHNIPLKNIHMIGHGRGCIVNNLVAQQLKQNENSKNVSIDQITNLGPYKNEYEKELTLINWDEIYSDTYYQSNGKVLNLSQIVYEEIFEEILDIVKNDEQITDKLKNVLEQISNINENEKSKEKQKLINSLIKKGIEILTLYIENSKNPEKYVLKHSLETINLLSKLNQFYEISKSVYDGIYNSNFNSNATPGSQNFEWMKYKNLSIIDPSQYPNNEFIGICDVYTESIKNAKIKSEVGLDGLKGGYQYSRINFGESFRKRLTVLDKPNFNQISLNYFNGDFIGNAKNIAGWSMHGGGLSYKLPDRSGILEHIPLISNGIAQLTCLDCFTEPTILKHNRYLVPNNAKSIVFSFKTNDNIKSGIVKARVIRVQIGQELVPQSDIEAIKELSITGDEFNRTNIRTIDVNVEKFKDKVINLQFEFSKAAQFNSNSYPTVYLTNVRVNSN